MNMIVCADRNWGIGLKGRLLVRIPSDLKLLRGEINGKTVVMGRKTLEGLPGGRPFDGCTNIVMSRRPGYEVKGALVCRDKDELLSKLEKTSPDDICVIGGGQIYRLLLPYTDTVHVTKVNHAYQADTFFPDLDSDEHWRIGADSEEKTYFDLEYRHLRYDRI